MDEPRRPVEDLREATHRLIPGWIARSVLSVVEQQGLDHAKALRLIDAHAPLAAAAALAALDELLLADVDNQRTNPLAILRDHVGVATAILNELGATPPKRDPFDERVAPGDLYGLGPATWTDVDPDLAEPGLVWGAWKAATVLERRRNEGLR